eukprot:61695-Pelagomonas_calceolata.AAC.1
MDIKRFKYKWQVVCVLKKRPSKGLKVPMFIVTRVGAYLAGGKLNISASNNTGGCWLKTSFRRAPKFTPLCHRQKQTPGVPKSAQQARENNAVKKTVSAPTVVESAW